MTESEAKQLVDLLSKLEPGFLPYPIFKEIARLVVMPIIEFVPLRTREGKVEILLVKRDENDDIWPGELHTPGTIMRATDKSSSMHKAFKRILDDELENTAVSDPHYVGSMFHVGRRGTEHAQIYWVEVLEEPKVGKFYPANNLPKQMMEQQKKFVAQAVQSYRKVKKA